MERVFLASPWEYVTEFTVPEPSSDEGNKLGKNFFALRPANDLMTLC